MSPEDLATQLLELGPEGLTETLDLLDQKLVEMGASLQAVVDQIGGGEQAQGQPMEEGPVMYQEDANVFAAEEPMAMPAPGSRQRISMR